MTVKKTISPSDLRAAKKKFMQYQTVTSIAKELNIARTSLNHYVNKEWKLERDLSRSDLVSQLSSSKKVDFTRMTQAAITIISKSLQNLALREAPPSTREAKDAVEILDKLDKITRLDNGDPTEILRDEKPATIIEIKEKLALDPFLTEIEDVEEIKEITIDKS